MLPALLPLIAFLFDDDGNSTGKSIIEFLVEKTTEFLDLLLEFYKPLFDVIFHGFEFAYTQTFGTFTDFVISLVNRQSDDFVLKGKMFVDSFFTKLNFMNQDFTDNFLFWVIGLFLFAFCAKFFFSFTFGLLKSALDFILKFK